MTIPIEIREAKRKARARCQWEANGPEYRRRIYERQRKRRNRKRKKALEHMEIAK